MTPNRVIVVGSRGFTDYSRLCRKLDKILSQMEGEVEIVSGGARGADRLGERYALERNLICTVMRADWNIYGKSAGYRRNENMARYATHLVAFWDGVSKGTGHMIAIAEKLGMPRRVIKFSGEEQYQE